MNTSGQEKTSVFFIANGDRLQRPYSSKYAYCLRALVAVHWLADIATKGGRKVRAHIHTDLACAVDSSAASAAGLHCASSCLSRRSILLDTKARRLSKEHHRRLTSGSVFGSLQGSQSHQSSSQFSCKNMSGPRSSSWFECGRSSDGSDRVSTARSSQ